MLVYKMYDILFILTKCPLVTFSYWWSMLGAQRGVKTDASSSQHYRPGALPRGPVALGGGAPGSEDRSSFKGVYDSGAFGRS